MKNIALKETATIFIAIILGLAIGMIGKHLGFTSVLENWLSPIGFFFIKILKLIALPLIIVSIVSGIAQMKDISTFSKLGKKTIITYLSTTVFAVSLGLILANIMQAGNWLSQQEKEEIRTEASFTLDDKEEVTTASLNFILDLIPENIFAGLSNNQNMLQILLLSIFFGIAILYTPQKTQSRLADIFTDLNEVVMQVISFIMKLAPIGVLALMSDLIIKTSNPKMGMAILGYAMTVVLVLFILVFLFYPFLIKYLTGISRKEFNTAIRPAQLNGLATSSSAATLPITIKCLQENLNISKEVSGLVPTLGSSINMDGSAAYIAVAAIFVSQIFDIPLSFYDHLMILVGASVASIGAAAVPSGAIILMFTVFETVGLPSEGIGLIIGLDRPLDLLRTACNVSGDCAVSVIVDKIKK